MFESWVSGGRQPRLTPGYASVFTRNLLICSEVAPPSAGQEKRLRKSRKRLAAKDRYRETCARRQLLLRTALVSKLFVPVKSPIKTPAGCREAPSGFFCVTLRSLIPSGEDWQNQQTKDTTTILVAIARSQCILFPSWVCYELNNPVRGGIC